MCAADAELKRSTCLHEGLANSLAWGLARIARLAEQSANHDLVVQVGTGERIQRGDCGNFGELSSVRALDEFLRHIDSARFRWYPTAKERLSAGGALAY